MPYSIPHDSEMYAARIRDLCSLVEEYAKECQISSGVILLIADFESDRSIFRQERSYYYLTGIEESASMYLIDMQSGKITLYIPNFQSIREQWIASSVILGQETKYKVDEIVYAGQPCKGYQCYPFFNRHEFSTVIARLQDYVTRSCPIFTLSSSSPSEYFMQRFVLQQMNLVIDGLQEAIVDISSVVAQMRRKKSKRELELMYHAIEITIDAHDTVARMLVPNKLEYEIQASLEYMFTFSGALPAFPSIVASGKHATTLHYTKNDKLIEDGDMVVVDIGAEYNYYCADITRTYPVSGTFSERQREIYQIVLDTQAYIAGQSRPGMWLSSNEYQDKSLNHLARQYLKDQGYEKYFPHGIGHYLGLDVHDVGDYSVPLAANDVITIEPGIYIPEEALGVRIEDDYWVVEDGVVCMSEALPKGSDDIEEMMQQQMDDIE